ncbi:hypothetical protein [Novosphingobium sp.]|uniref:hypothetical protein n=1 Tax=Novosphingobium sp. TaxID=1874826 RepID=UPI002FE21DD1
MARMIERSDAAVMTVDVTGVAAKPSGFEITGIAARGWACEGAEVRVALNPAGTAFREGVLGQGRVYDDRIEIDLILDGRAEQDLVRRLREDRVLVLHGTPITGSLLRITGFELPKGVARRSQ